MDQKYFLEKEKHQLRIAKTVPRIETCAKFGQKDGQIPTMSDNKVHRLKKMEPLK